MKSEKKLKLLKPGIVIHTAISLEIYCMLPGKIQWLFGTETLSSCNSSGEQAPGG